MKRLKITVLCGIVFILAVILGCIVYTRYTAEAAEVKPQVSVVKAVKPDCTPPPRAIHRIEEKEEQPVEEAVKMPSNAVEAEPIKVQWEGAKIESTAVSARIWTESDALMMAKVMYGEACGIRSMTEVACIGWTILNRVDAGWGSIAEVITAPYQFYYLAGAPTVSQTGIDLYALACDVLTRWEREHNGELYVGRVLPSDYMWYGGDGAHNHFRTAYSGGMIWDYSWGTVYPS